MADSLELALAHIDARLRRIVDTTTATMSSPANRAALARLAEAPRHLVDLLLTGSTVRAIYIGVGAVPDLDDMGHLHGVPVRAERPRLLWDHTSGAYRNGVLLLGDLPGIPSASCDVPAHEIGHAICIADGYACYQPEFGELYAECRGRLAAIWADRDEAFAEIFAAVLTGNVRWLTSLVSDDVDLAQRLWVWCSRRYGLWTEV